MTNAGRDVVSGTVARADGEATMARGGYLATELALTRLAKVVGDRREASRLLCDAMVSGVISARGRPNLKFEEERGPGPLILRDMGSPPPPVLGPIQDIPATFWKEADFSDQGRRFETGFAMAPSDKFKESAYNAITLSEKEVNAFVELHTQGRNDGSVGSAKKERSRQGTWEDWVAALATLAHEQQISGKMSQTDLLDLIETRLGKWDVEVKPTTTVQTTARRVLERFKINPPATPFEVENRKKP